MIHSIIAYIEDQLESCQSEDQEAIYEDLLKNLKGRLGNLNKRKEIFRDDVRRIMKKGYSKDVCRSFYNYWTETDRARNPKMKFEKEKTWDTELRLNRWASSSYNK